MSTGQMETPRVPRLSADIGRETVFGSQAAISPQSWGAPPAPRPDSAIDNEAELREDLALAGKNLMDAEAAHAQAVAASERGAVMLRQAAEAVAAAHIEADRAGGNLAERIAAWATAGGEDPGLGLTDAETAAHGRHTAALATEKAASQAVEALTASLAARTKQLDAARIAKQAAAYRVIARDMEVNARRVEALRAEADRLAHGVALFGMEFGPQARDGSLRHMATQRVAGAYHQQHSGAGALTMGAAAAARGAVGAYRKSLMEDPNAPLPVSLGEGAPPS